MWKLAGEAPDFSLVSFANENWMTAFVLLVLLFLTILMVVYRHKFLLVLKCLYSKRAFSQLSKEGKIFSEGSFLFSVPVIVLSLALGLSQLIATFVPDFQFNLPFIQLCGIIAAAIVAFYVLRVILNLLLFRIFEHDEERYDFHLIGLSFLLNSSIVLWVSTILVKCTNFPFLFLVTALIISALFILKIYKDLFFIAKQVNLFQFFMYFCTLEILPCLVVLKLLF
ncbi:MAG: DUF4271 domain-containing protein [Bacteroidales bacterium]|nr:DUF4271 domain-containing protein [Bacteroidales bacterium]